MINVYTSEINERIKYIFRLVFETILGDMVEFFTVKENFNNAIGIKINYSNDLNTEGLIIRPNKLLFETHLQVQHIEIFEWKEEKAFFKSERSFIPFDLFAASFYLVSRYEEYLPGKRDRHQRFMSRNSLAGQNRFLEKPLVNIWIAKMADLIEQKNEGYKFNRPAFNYIPTLDIDNAWAFKNKGAIRLLASTFKDILNGRWKVIGKRYSVIFRFKKDPYDNYDFIEELFKKYKLRPIFFFLLNRKGRHDRSLSHRNLYLRQLIKKMTKVADIGIHPSYSSTRKKTLLRTEIERLKQIVGKDIEFSRQHYLKLSMPKTYRELLKNDIKSDYSMGYSNRPGFRASICTPFLFYDLIEEKETNLTIYPFEIMDVTLLNYRGMRPDEAKRKIKALMQETIAVGGTFISLWHNESLSDEGHWEGWRSVYTDMTQMAADNYYEQQN